DSSNISGVAAPPCAFDVAIIEPTRLCPIPHLIDSFAELPKQVTANPRETTDRLCSERRTLRLRRLITNASGVLSCRERFETRTTQLCVRAAPSRAIR
ncbi:MAG: hypothetical protein ABI990_11185, partial [Actinomycetota bacterium]